MTQNAHPRPGSKEGIDAWSASLDEALSGYETQRAADFAAGSRHPLEAFEWADDRTEPDTPDVTVTHTTLADVAANLLNGVPVVTRSRLEGRPFRLQWEVIEQADGTEVSVTATTTTDEAEVSRRLHLLELEINHYFIGPPDTPEPEQVETNAQVVTVYIQETDGALLEHYHVTEVASITTEKLDDGTTRIVGDVTVDRCAPPPLDVVRQALLGLLTALEGADGGGVEGAVVTLNAHGGPPQVELVRRPEPASVVA